MDTQTGSGTLQEILDKQRAFFRTGATQSLAWRKEHLRQLRVLLTSNETEIAAALHTDLRKSESEVIATELFPVLDEIDYHLKRLDRWMQPEKVRSSLLTEPSKSEIRRVPFGCALIIGTWNYPLNLILLPLVGSISGGNCAVLKPSELAPATSRLVKKLISERFDEHFIAVVEGGAEVAEGLLSLRFDTIFFTGSPHIGKIVMQKAAENLIPVTLELGGKSPAIVHKDADIKKAARRVMWGKLINCGQTCIAPDFLLVHESVKAAFLEEAASAVRKFFGRNPQKAEDYGRIISGRHHERLVRLMSDPDLHVIFGGGYDVADKYIEPTLLDGVSWDHPLMKEEIFGPILPVLTFTDPEPVIDQLQAMENPLALYVFTASDSFAERILREVPHGGSCINDTIMHIVNPNLPFGGAGTSGIGQYHGRYSFEAFTRPQSVMRRGLFPDPSFRYPPYKRTKFFLKKFLLRD